MRPTKLLTYVLGDRDRSMLRSNPLHQEASLGGYQIPLVHRGDQSLLDIDR